MQHNAQRDAELHSSILACSWLGIECMTADSRPGCRQAYPYLGPIVHAGSDVLTSAARSVAISDDVAGPGAGAGAPAAQPADTTASSRESFIMSVTCREEHLHMCCKPPASFLLICTPRKAMQPSSKLQTRKAVLLVCAALRQGAQASHPGCH